MDILDMLKNIYGYFDKNIDEIKMNENSYKYYEKLKEKKTIIHILKFYKYLSNFECIREMVA